MSKRSKFALWGLGFRPFFLLASLFGAGAVALWLCFFFGVLPYSGALNPTLWHSHEMVFGFSGAVIAGFVLTAIQNWTGMKGVEGRKLQMLVGLWCLARALMCAPFAFRFTAAFFDLVFFPALAWVLLPYFKSPELRVERVFFAFFGLFFLSNVLVHLDGLGWVDGHARKGVLLGLHTVVIVIVFIGGRVIPFFTESSIARAQPKTWPKIEQLSHASVWTFLVTQFFWESSTFAALIALATGSIHAVRAYGWYVRRVVRVPILWILHVSYLWMIIGFFLYGLVPLQLFAPSVATHALTVGTIGSMVYGMMSRVSLGHTGRPLRPPTSVVAGYWLVSAAAVARLLPVLINGTWLKPAVLASGVLWIVAFALFGVAYGGILMRPRIDGRGG